MNMFKNWHWHFASDLTRWLKIFKHRNIIPSNGLETQHSSQNFITAEFCEQKQKFAFGFGLSANN